ncbi:YlmH family RNA-binding protein [Lacticaseibacillus daqingensis]|uniref:YlmH family RNA-binding protein n=1 Tax=Lacticaseibacillus daqingensis TaxID=2486014 RepID=UPI000F76D5FD|nr:YlmH/Sll1252 family protein [Lacticaseibacillus daqingensis]
MDAIYQHFRKSEAPLIAALADSIGQAATEYRPVLTDFLDPRQWYIAQTLIGAHGEVRAHAFGGYPGAERVRVLFAPDYFTPTPGDFEVAPLALKYPTKFAELTHSQVLGTLANSGIDRAQFGDIITDGARWQVFTTRTMSDWTQRNIDKIGRIGVRFEPIDLAAVVQPTNDWEPAQLTMTRVRLDSLVGHTFNISRARAKALVEAQKVQLNFAVSTAPDLAVGLADIVSVRGFGRVRVDALPGETKKGKQRVSVSVIHK